MVIFFLMVITGLAALNFYQYKVRKNEKGNFTYIHKKLKQIIDNQTDEKLLVHTGDEELKQILIEINRLLEHNQKMMASYNKMEASMRKMLSNISHDLKTPLTVVLGYIEIMLNNPNRTNEETKELLQKVNVKTVEVLDLIKKFFDLAKLESGDKDLPLTRVNMNEVCQKNILQFYEVLSAKGFDVVIELPETIQYALGNGEALDRVLNNLLSNAIQYGGEGKVLGLTLRSDQQYVFIDIWDKGKGISELHKDLVFERMYTLEDSRNKSYQGSGLGLTITKRLVEKMDGHIFLNSKPYEKTTFTVQVKRITY
ncbi:sensor histidine kinase [Neobacillus sp. MM2021_6]|uniref:sensor histidine kinase n=1 Tax=Bacillaceae TaxID=186817 RepID=UPI00140B5670|nr:MULTISPECIES: sensor histidine kinase [Bacillaceae]MBO0959804.1 sensor histidine kinase [Neobacillus sp. MM2021_6]NHC20106.1 HAMP domain-containing histidine kinase [Bacillus sp. MM2020_4]